MKTSGTADFNLFELLPGNSVSKNRYIKLIKFAQSRGFVDGYFERHHIIPRSEGGKDIQENFVALKAREHFLAHWLLYRVYKTPASARSFKLMTNDQNKKRGKDYEEARKIMSESMIGNKNVSKRPEVQQKIKERCYSVFKGKKRPEHSLLLKSRGVFKGINNPLYGCGDKQRGNKNHMAKKVVGIHPFAGVCVWNTCTDASNDLGVSLQAITQSIKKNYRSKGWRLEHSV